MTRGTGLFVFVHLAQLEVKSFNVQAPVKYYIAVMYIFPRILVNNKFHLEEVHGPWKVSSSDPSGFSSNDQPIIVDLKNWTYIGNA
ncbi:hypothetical protein RO3G_01007 [Rhizopus delemar RA 99-880]|uniref:Uncharacterized protein n=1 Tax=Rhizopus delemar (strain RA 99-880 / ATCC MYA-4621 / FGSC 9543 / NRRL 43880) TaxID=246409 RepID=I1BJC3_RHIO9|nr:hypothetical protein RO3G_01007 [Rhizopus delemar RA 99-880]|eukprot:EIE76303.1 hypothetical protein RO3G_01007 [Rhizopus delemar RA 99-880]